MKVFLSYSHLDATEPEGWVQTFHERLEKMAKVYVGDSRLQIWRDTQSRDYRYNNIKEIVKDGLSGSSLLITLISPSYLNDHNKWGKFERSYFIRKVVKDEEKGRERIINVVKLLLSQEEIDALPDELANNFRYTFCEYTEGNLAETVMPGNGNYEKEMKKVVYAIAKQIKQHTARSPLKVFLARPSADLFAKELEIRMEIEKHFKDAVAFTTVDPSADKTKWKQSIEAALKDACLSVHLIGTIPIPVNDDFIEQFQWKVATQYSELHSLKVVTWMSKEAHETITHPLFTGEIRKLVDEVKSCTIANHDFICKSPEELKSTLREIIRQKTA